MRFKITPGSLMLIGLLWGKLTRQVRKTRRFLGAIFLISKTIVCQDRLGTNKRKEKKGNETLRVSKNGGVFIYFAGALVGVGPYKPKKVRPSNLSANFVVSPVDSSEEEVSDHNEFWSAFHLACISIHA